jgi:hypothetical protein
MGGWRGVPSLQQLRTIALFITGLAAFVYEVVVDKADRPTILILAAGMMGLPLFINRESAKKSNGDPPSQGGQP